MHLASASTGEVSTCGSSALPARTPSSRSAGAATRSRKSARRTRGWGSRTRLSRPATGISLPATRAPKALRSVGSARARDNRQVPSLLMPQPTPPVADVDAVRAALADHEYLADEGLATAIFLALTLRRPLLL